MLTIINAFDLSINMAHSGSTLRPKSTYLPSCWKGWKDGKEYIKMSYHLSSIIHFCFLLCNEHYSLKGVLYIFSVVDYCLIIKTNFIMISAVRISVLFFYYTQKNQNGLLIIWSSICLYCIYLSAVFCSTDTLNYSHWPLLHLTASSFFLSLLPFHYTAALWCPSRTAYRSVSRGGGRPIHPVIHHAPGPSEARPAHETSLPRRHLHPSSPRPTEPVQHRWRTRDNTPSAAFRLIMQAFLTMTMTISAGADLAAGLHLVLSFILYRI